MLKKLRVRGARWYTGVIIGVGCAALLILMQLTGVFSQARLNVNNVYYGELPTSGSIVIVAIDDKSLDTYGRSPNQWSRAVYADLVTQLDQARVVTFDLIFNEPQEEDNAFVEAIQAAGSASENSIRFVFAASGARAPFQDATLPNYPQAVQITNALYPVEPLANIANSIGYVDSVVDVDGLIRRQPSILQVGDAPFPGLGIASYMAYLRIPASALSQVITSDDDTLSVTSNRGLPIDARGFWMQQFFGEAGTAFPVYSLTDVIEGVIEPGTFEDKIVLVGLYNSTGITDRYPVPVATSGTTMPGVEIHAHAIETIIQNNALKPQSQLMGVLVISVLSVAAGGLYMAFRWYIKLGLWAIVTGLMTLAAFTVFSTQQIIIDLLYVWLALALPLALTLLVEIATEISRRRRSEFLLNSISQVERQRLKLDRIWSLLVADVRKIAPRSSGAILTLQGQPIQWIGIETEADQAAFQQALPHHHDFPFSWQGKTYGILYLQGRLPARTQTILTDLSRRLAPALDNANLFQAINQQNETLEAIFATTPESIVFTDPNLVVERSNEAFQMLTRNTAASGESFVDLLPINDATASDLRESFAEGLPFKFEIIVNAKTLNVGAAPLSDEGWVIILADVTRLAELNTLKTRMLRMASHDLKNPLSRINGFAELVTMMEDEVDAKKVHSYIGYIKKAGDEMLNIIRDILESEQLRTGDVLKDVLNFVQITHEIIGRYEPDLARKNQTFTHDIPDEVIVMMGNYRQISQVVSNILSNAIKYTPDGGSVHVRLTKQGTNALLEVKDTGYGISEAAQKNLFTDFYRVQTTETAEIEGTGLGLSLVKSVVENHNGRVWVNSKEGEGSTFYVELPIYTTIVL